MYKFSEYLNESRRLTPDQVKKVLRRYIDNENDRDNLDSVLSKIYQIPVEKELNEFLDEKGLRGNAKTEMSKILSEKIVTNRTASAGEKLDFVNELRSGQVYDVKGVINDSVNSDSPTNILQSKYFISTNKAITKDFISWFWTWEPQFDKRNVGGGETLMILCDPEGGKGEGGKGDAYLGSGYNIEIKKSTSKGETPDSAASFGDNSNFNKARSEYMTKLQDAYRRARFITGPPDAKDLRDSYLPSSGSSKDGRKISLAINDTAYRLKEHCGYSDSQIEEFIAEICIIAHGLSSFSGLMKGVVNNGVADPNKFIKRWCAAGMDSYQRKQGFDVLFYFDSQNGNAMGFRTPQQMIQKEDMFDVDWVLNWTEGGYGHSIPRIFVPRTASARKVAIVADTAQIERQELGIARINAFDVLIDNLAKSSRRPSTKMTVKQGKKTVDVMTVLDGLPSGVYQLPGYDAIKTQDQADNYKKLKNALVPTYTSIKNSAKRDGFDVPSDMLRKVLSLSTKIQSGLKKSGFGDR